MSTQRLPRGRHQLSRAEVEADQRLRMLVALAEAMATKGYVGTTVADVIKGAGVSRETFYQQFSSKLDCFGCAFDAAAEVVFDGLGGLLLIDGDPVDRFAQAFTAYLETLAANPAFARVFLVEVYAAGPEAVRRRADLQQRVVAALADLLDARTEPARFACEVLVAATGSLVTVPLVEGDLDALRALSGPMVDLVRRAHAAGQLG